MTTTEKIEIMQACESGKPIQVYDGVKWIDITAPIWNWETNLYRIKPEKTYRAYRDTAEMITDFKERFGVNVPSYAKPLIWVKVESFASLITAFESNTVWLLGFNCVSMSLSRLFYTCTYLDGTPCGKLEE